MTVVALFWLGDHPWLIAAAVVVAGLVGIAARRAWLAWALPAALTAALAVYAIAELVTYDDRGRDEATTFLLGNVAVSLVAWIGAGVAVVLCAARVRG